MKKLSFLELSDMKLDEEFEYLGKIYVEEDDLHEYKFCVENHYINRKNLTDFENKCKLELLASTKPPQAIL
jgi:hypothetical protein